ncbi:MAG TPA: hypothetical protein VLQ45_30005 [Thermoanaerobaculia bacterium]|nr:hypothetical protein [Thermoanaerobaculia bacterium]
MDTKVISETEICSKLLAPAVTAAGRDAKTEDVIRNAGVVAERILLGNVAEREWGGTRRPVLLTGGTKYLELWGRDSAASLAALPASHRQVWSNTLEAFLHHQRADGLLPRKVAGFGNAERNLRSIVTHQGISLPLSLTLTPEYRTAGYKGRSRFMTWVAKKILIGTAGEPKDTNPLILLSLARYARHEPEFLARHELAVRKALAYLERHTREGLLWQNDHEDWLDVYGRQGHLFYTNALYFASLRELAQAFRSRDRRMAADLVRTARRVRERLQDLWDPERGHFISHHDGKEAHRQFATDGNMLALLTGLAEARQRESILGNLERIVDEYGYVPIVTPSYPARLQAGLRRVFVWKYRDGRLLKPWLQILAAKAVAAERPALAARILLPVARIFVEHGCCEVMNGDTGQPHEFFLTRTEKRFTVAAALYLEAAAALALS